jgi:hypothetical protein
MSTTNVTTINPIGLSRLLRAALLDRDHLPVHSTRAAYLTFCTGRRLAFGRSDFPVLFTTRK